MPQQFIQKPGGEPIELLKAINPVTGQPYAGLQEASDIGGYSPIATPVIGVDETANEISQGTDGIADENTLLQNQIDQMAQDTEAGVDTRGIDIGAEFESLQQQASQLGLTSEAELKQIEEAGVAAGAEFDPKIAGAQERMRMGMGAAIVATGRYRGGFQRARYAGEAALGPTAGDVGYVGVGGKLEVAESAYQRNVDALRAQKTRAIALAKAQARQAIRTGKQSDFDNAKSMLEFARKMDEDAKSAEQRMLDNLFKMQQEERLQTTSEFNIIKNLGEGQTIDIRGVEYTGIKSAEIDPFWTSASIVSLAKEIPVGETRTVIDPALGEITIEGLQQDDPKMKQIQATDDQGNQTITSYRVNEDGSLEITGQASAGQVGKTKTRAASTTIILNEQQAGILGDSAAVLNASVGDDGYFNTDTFIKEREKVAATSGGDVGKFDELFTPRLNPGDTKAIPFIEPSLRPKTDKSVKDIIAEKLQNINIEIK